MKYSLLQKTISPLLLGLCMSAAVFCGSTTETRAEKLSVSTDSGSGILQEGGLLTEDPDQGIMLLDLSTDTEGAKKALEDALKEIRTEVNISSYGISRSQMSSLLAQVVNGNPQFFYYAGCSYSYNSATNYVVNVTFKYSADIDTIKSQAAAYESAVQDILSGIQPSWSDLEKALYVNDYLAVHCEYDTTYSMYTAYHALVDHTAVCQGYALAYQDLMNRLGIPCEYVSSSQLNHAWNLIQIENSWYHVDVTWNDPIKDRYGRARHAYFLKSTDWFKTPSTSDTAHNADDYIYSGSASDAAANSTAFDGYFWNDVDSPFGWYNGYWYANNGGSLYKYQFASSGMTGSSVYKALNQKWPVFGGSGYWQGAYDGCIVYGNKLYYASPQSILVLDLASGSTSPSTAYTISDTEKSQGYIYGFRVTEDGILKYGIAQSPNEAAESKEAVLHTHSYGDWIVTKAPTCTEAGEQTQTCSGCGISKKETVAATGHDYDGGVITTQPTCAADGVLTFTCRNCGDSYTESIPKTSEHSYGDWITVSDSSCTAEGLKRRTCSICGAYEEETIPKKEHTPGPAASCTEPQICTECQTVLNPATGHDYDDGVITTQPTCVADGALTFTCQTCGDSYTESISKTSGHSYGNWITVSDSSCSEDGLKRRTCSVCNASEEEIIPKKGHAPGPDASCTSAQTCTSCGITLAKATGHIHTQTKTTKAATFLKTGKASVVCKDCGAVVSTKTIAKVKCKKGQTYTVGNYKYKIVTAKTNGKGTVAFTGLVKNTSKVTIKDNVTILGVKFNIVQIGDRALKNKSAVTSVTIGKNVTTIGKEAFYGTKKLKTVTIKSTKLTKVGSNALKNTYAKAKIKVPKAKLSKYKTLFKNKGQKKTVKIY